MFKKIKGLLPYLGAIAIFMVITALYFSPVLEGKMLPQMDNKHAIGMAQELVEFEKESGERSPWTNSCFSGMPSYQIRTDASNNIFNYLNRVIKFGLPYHTMAIMFVYLLGFYLLLLSFKVDNWLSVIGAVAFAFGSYNLVIIIVGHITKAYTIGLMAPVIAGVLFTYNRKLLLGGLFTTLALGLQIVNSHVQITYYLFLLILVLVVCKFIYAIMHKELERFFKASAVLLGALVLALLPNLYSLWPTYEYSKFSIRGASELTSEDGEKKGDGLDKSYALAWSYGKAESLTFLVPNLLGGASDPLAQNPSAMASAKAAMGNDNPQMQASLEQYVGQSMQYWGDKGWTEGPVYAGAIICFLFMLGIFFYKGGDKWWLIAGTVLSFLLAWGKNFGWFTDLMFDYFPLYNKFRTVEMALVIASFTVPLLAILGLREVTKTPELIKNNSGKFFWALGLTGGVSLVLYLFPGAFFNFFSERELQGFAMQKQQSPQMAAAIDTLMAGIEAARLSLLKTDALRSFVFIVLGSGSLWFFSTEKLSLKYLLPGLGILILVDLWGVDKRYVNNDSFQPGREITNQFVASKADKEILKDKDPSYRVFSIYLNPFTEVNTSYFHKSIGGYHGAKMRRYQDLIERYLEGSLRELQGMLREGVTPEMIDAVMANQEVLNMLNTRYFIYNPQAAPLVNPHALGNAWFVNNVLEVISADEEVAAIGGADLSTTAVVETSFKDFYQGYQTDSVEGSISLEVCEPDYLKYQSTAGKEQLAVFSEIYYTKGWKAFIDGKPVEFFRANYVLRAMMVPQGHHTIEFKYEPTSYYAGQTLAMISSILILLLILGIGYKEWKSGSVGESQE